MDNMCLPQDYIDFLQSGKTLNYNPKICLCGKLELLPLKYLFYSEVYVDSENATFAKFDPHASEYGYYPVPAVDLVASCDRYSPDGILVWLPDQGLFGSWDCDHYDLIIFPGVTWTQIVAAPVKYINSQWYPKGVICEYFQPFPRYHFKTGDPWD